MLGLGFDAWTRQCKGHYIFRRIFFLNKSKFQINTIRTNLGEENYRKLMSSQDVDILKSTNEFIDLGIPELKVVDINEDGTLEATMN